MKACLEWKDVVTFGDGFVTSQRTPERGAETWKTDKKIGGGGFGAVHKQIRIPASDGSTGLHTTPTVRAVKSIPEAIHQNNRKAINMELSTLIAVRKYTDNFVEFYGWYEDSANTVYIAMEYIAGGDLQAYMLQNRARAKRHCRTITTQILTALDILHKSSICHRDLKPQNVLVQSASPIKVKLADFGISKSTSSDASGMQTLIGTNKYMAPEILGYSPYRKAGMKYTQAVDIWALGLLTHEIYTGKIPFSYETVVEIDDEEISGVVPAGSSNSRRTTTKAMLDPVKLVRYCDKERQVEFPETALQNESAPYPLLHFVQSLLLPDPLKRLSVSDAILHPWITGQGMGGVSNAILHPAITGQGMGGAGARRHVLYCRACGFGPMNPVLDAACANCGSSL